MQDPVAVDMNYWLRSYGADDETTAITTPVRVGNLVSHLISPPRMLVRQVRPIAGGAIIKIVVVVLIVVVVVVVVVV